ncbi:MAG TPA: cation diffusion facilitator family transporter [Sphingomonas sp.]
MSGADVSVPNLARRAAIASVTMATMLLALKAYGEARSGSVAMLASLADTALDLLASMMTLYGVHIAGQRADEQHRFGHGKAESLVALFQVALIAASAVALAIRAAMGLVRGGGAVEAGTGILVSLIAAGATVVLLAYQRFVIARTRSVAIGADHLHYQSDLALNGAVVAALLLDRFAGIGWADAAFGLAIALWLARGAWISGRIAVDQLMDREWPETRRRALLDLAATIPALKGMHDLRTRSSGTDEFAQFHVPFPAGTSLAAAHAAMRAVEARLALAFPDTQFFLHPHPEGYIDPEGALPAAIAERSEM